MVNINEIDSKDISLSSFKIKKELHPKFWPNGKLNSRIRLRLMDIADDFIDELSVDWVKPSDVILTGSIANYNWSRYSDVDIHILIDFKKVYPKSSDFVDDYFKAKKENWLSVHEDLKIFGFPIEISVEDSNEDNPSSGRYSLYKNKWIVEPDDFQDATINQEFVKKRAAEFMTQLDTLEKQLNSEKDTHKCEKYGDKAYKIFDKLKNMRGEGLKSSKKEMSSGNIIYKIIRRTGYLDKIWEIVNASYDKVNSIDEKKEINEAQQRGQSFSAGIIPFRMNKNGKTEVFLGFPGQPRNKDFNPPMWMNRWQILKGHMENGEDPKECAIREFCEESGASSKLIQGNKLINLGKEKMTDGRSLICYGLDLTDDKTFNKTKFHSNPIDKQKYIDLNGGKPYPEIVKYAWKEVNNVGGSAPYETSFYQKCDEICQNRYSETNGKKTIVISNEQKKQIKETIEDETVTYHNSHAKFDKFDHSHMGEGHGTQWHGWGTYLSAHPHRPYDPKYDNNDQWAKKDRKAHKYQYSVEIPDTKNGKYIEEDTQVPKYVYNTIINKFKVDIPINYQDKTYNYNWDTRLWRGMIMFLGDLLTQKECSLFLRSLGYVGIHYYGAYDGESFVIFDENDMNIVNVKEFNNNNSNKKVVSPSQVTIGLK